MVVFWLRLDLLRGAAWHTQGRSPWAGVLAHARPLGGEGGLAHAGPCLGASAAHAGRPLRALAAVIIGGRPGTRRAVPRGRLQHTLGVLSGGCRDEPWQFEGLCSRASVRCLPPLMGFADDAWRVALLPVVLKLAAKLSRSTLPDPPDRSTHVRVAFCWLWV